MELIQRFIFQRIDQFLTAPVRLIMQYWNLSSQHDIRCVLALVAPAADQLLLDIVKAVLGEPAFANGLGDLAQQQSLTAAVTVNGNIKTARRRTNRIIQASQTRRIGIFV